MEASSNTIVTVMRVEAIGSGVRLFWFLLGLSICQVVGPLTFCASALPSVKWGGHMARQWQHLGWNPGLCDSRVPVLYHSILCLDLHAHAQFERGTFLKQTFKFYFFVPTKEICFFQASKF